MELLVDIDKRLDAAFKALSDTTEVLYQRDRGLENRRMRVRTKGRRGNKTNHPGRPPIRPKWSYKSKPTTCHPDRKHHALGLCKSCYKSTWKRNNRERSKA